MGIKWRPTCNTTTSHLYVVQYINLKVNGDPVLIFFIWNYFLKWVASLHKDATFML